MPANPSGGSQASHIWDAKPSTAAVHRIYLACFSRKAVFPFPNSHGICTGAVFGGFGLFWRSTAAEKDKSIA
jgi:hypothetical protein